MARLSFFFFLITFFFSDMGFGANLPPLTVIILVCRLVLPKLKGSLPETQYRNPPGTANTSEGNIPLRSARQTVSELDTLLPNMNQETIHR
jgi:hypothetical protein